MTSQPAIQDPGPGISDPLPPEIPTSPSENGPVDPINIPSPTPSPIDDPADPAPAGIPGDMPIDIPDPMPSEVPQDTPGTMTA